MSPRRSIQLTPQEQSEFLNNNQKVALATLDKDGFPHVVAMNYFYKDGAVYMTSYGKAQKVVNIRRNPKVGLMVETGRTYGELRGVMIRGNCEIIDEPERVRQAFREMGVHQGARAEIPRESINSTPKRVVLKVTPARIASWDHSKLGGKY